MHGQERRRLAIETFIKFDHSYADTIAELGYPTRSALRAWWNEHERTGEVPASRFATNPKYTAEMRRRAVEHYLEHGKSLARTMRALGYPKSREKLCEWVDELAPGRRRHRGPRPRREAISLERKVRVVAELEARDGSAAGMAGRHGAPGTAPGCRGTCRSRAPAGRPRDGKRGPGRRPGAAGRRGEGGDGDGAGGRARALRGPARGGHGQGRLRVREERAARGRGGGTCRRREVVAGASGAIGGALRPRARRGAGRRGRRAGGRAAHGVTGGEACSRGWRGEGGAVFCQVVLNKYRIEI